MLSLHARRLYAVPIAALLTLSALYGAGCGGDDDNSSSSGNINIDSGTSGSVDGSKVDGQTSSSSSSGSTSSSSGSIPDGGQPDVEVDAGPQPQPIGGTVTGLGTAAGLVLQLNGANDLAINGDGGFTFPTSTNLLPGLQYNVSIGTQPTGKTCTVSAASGTVANSPVTNVVVNCAGGTFTVGGNVTGLADGASVVLTNNNAEDVTVTSNNTFAFPTALGAGASYAVTVKTQPSSPAQNCVVTNGSGSIVNSNISNISVACTTASFAVSATVKGLAGSGPVVLQNNGGDNLSVTSNGTFPFATKVASGGVYAVTVLTNPSNPAQTCTVTSGGTGSVGGTAPAPAVIDCSTTAYKVGGTVFGLTGGGTLVLKDNANTDTVSVTADGAFTFPTSRNSGTTYNAQVQTNPNGQTCTVSAGGGTVGNGDVTSIVVNCAAGSFTVSGTINGLVGKVVLSDGTNTITPASGATSFSSPPLTQGTAYNVTVQQQPMFGTGANQTCTVTNPSGTINGANVTNVVINCTTNKFKVQGQLTGLANGSIVQFTDGAGAQTSTITVTGTGALTDTFTFPTTVSSGGTFNVTVVDPTPANPADGNVSGAPAQTCTPVGGTNSGTVQDGDVTTIRFNCLTQTYKTRVNVTGMTSGTLILRQIGSTTSPSPNQNTPQATNTTGNVTGTGGANLEPFTTELLSGTSYTVSVDTNPTFISGSSAAQTCNITSGGTGTVGSTNPVVNVACTTNAGTLSGNVVGLQANGGTNTVSVTLKYRGVTAGQPNGSDTTITETRDQNGNFTFQGATLASNTDYTATVVTQPNAPPQTCKVTGGTTVVSSGTCSNNPAMSCTDGAQCGAGNSCVGFNTMGKATGADAAAGSPITINCTQNRYVLGGIFTGGDGLAAASCTPAVPLDSGTLATDPTAPPCGARLLVTVTPPATDPALAESETQFFTGNGTGSTPFQFSRLLTTGSQYSVTVAQQPQQVDGQTGSRQQNCTVTNGTGTIGSGDVLGAAGPQISCTTTTRTLTANVSGNETGSNLKVTFTRTGYTAGGGATGTATLNTNQTSTSITGASGDTYTVSVVSPSNAGVGNPQLSCTVDAAGTAGVQIKNGTPTAVQITCARTTYSLSTVVQHLAIGTSVGLTLTCTNPGTATNCPAPQTITVNGQDNANAAAAWANKLPNGAGYAITLTTPPGPTQTGLLAQSCTIINPTGTIGQADLLSTAPIRDVFIPGDVTPAGGPIVRCARGLTCNTIHSVIADPNAPTGFYPIDPDGSGPIIPYRAYCDYTTDAVAGTSYTSIHVTHGIASFAKGQANSCPPNTDIVVPRDLAHQQAMFTQFPTGFSIVGGIYRDTNGQCGSPFCFTSSARDYTGCAFFRPQSGGNTADCNGGTAPTLPLSDWTSIAATNPNTWFIRSVTHSEPNGNYRYNGWLGRTGNNPATGFLFDDAGDGYTTTGDYVCSPNDK